jgi:integrase/recombinase XerD
MGKPSVKQHLAAMRMIGWSTGGVLATNPAHAIRGPKQVVERGKTPALAADQAGELLDSIDASTLIGLRDRELIGVMTDAFTRVGAAVAMRVENYFANGRRWWVRLHEKGGKRQEMPAHPQAGTFLDEYFRAASIGEEGRSPLFRAVIGRTGTLGLRPMNRVDVCHTVPCRVLAAGLPYPPGDRHHRLPGSPRLKST